MANLIITIIAIGLFAVAAISAIYYGGQAYQNGQIDALAGTTISESQQILVAQRWWATNKNQPDATNAGMNALLSSGALSAWPSLAGNSPAPNNGTVALSQIDLGCYSYQGYTGGISRRVFTYNSGNYVTYVFTANNNSGPCGTATANFTTSDTDISQINHPVVKIAKLINSKLGLPTYNVFVDSVGLPRLVSATFPTLALPTNGITGWFASNGNPAGAANPDGSIVSNFCYMVTPISTVIVCEFGPS